MRVKSAPSVEDAQLASIQRIMSETVQDVRCEISFLDGLVWCTVRVGNGVATVKLELFGGSFETIQREAVRLAGFVAQQRAEAGLERNQKPAGLPAK